MKGPYSTGSTVHVNCHYLQWNLLRKSDVDNKRVIDNYNVTLTLKEKTANIKERLLLRSLSVNEYMTPFGALLFVFQSDDPWQKNKRDCDDFQPSEFRTQSGTESDAIKCSLWPNKTNDSKRKF